MTCKDFCGGRWRVGRRVDDGAARLASGPGKTGDLGAVRFCGSRSRASLDVGHRPMGLAERSDERGDGEPRDEPNTDEERGCPRELTGA
jgi:hypothetical protein